MKFLIVSDSHGNYMALDELASKYPDMDFYLHLGDSEEDEWSIKPFISVRGNCDHYPYFQDELTIPTPLGNLFACHNPLVSRQVLKDKKIKFFCSGHTHRRRFEEKDGIVYFNPGSITNSRDGHELSYLILDINKEGYSYTFLSLEK